MALNADHVFHYYRNTLSWSGLFSSSHIRKLQKFQTIETLNSMCHSLLPTLVIQLVVGIALINSDIVCVISKSWNPNSFAPFSLLFNMQKKKRGCSRNRRRKKKQKHMPKDHTFNLSTSDLLSYNFFFLLPWLGLGQQVDTPLLYAFKML